MPAQPLGLVGAANAVENAYSKVAARGKKPRSMTRAHTAGILPKRLIAYMEQPVLDPPVTPNKFKQPLCVGLRAIQTGNPVCLLDALLPLYHAAATNHKHLPHTGPVEISIKRCSTYKLAMLDTAMSL